MKADMVRACAGEPSDIQVTLTEDGREEVWTYSINHHLILRLVLEDDRLTLIRYAK